MNNRVYIIAEAGVNHNGSLEMAKRLIEVAREAGADAVKFQTFKSEAVISRQAVKAAYQIQSTGGEESQLEMVKKLELSAADHFALVGHCAHSGIKFMSTPFDLGSLSLLVDELAVEILKLPSGEITNAPLLLEAARSGKPIILSTGMSTLADVEDALGVLAFGYCGMSEPSAEQFSAAYRSEAGQQALHRNVTLLQCTTEYPAPFKDANLRAMDTLKAAFGLRVGFSDHTPGISIPLAAVARGATVIEKHFTLDKGLPGPDHKASLEPSELSAMVRGIREVEQSLGSGLKQPANSEMGNRLVARKSLVAACAIRKGDCFTMENLTAKRSGGGLSPMRYWDCIGKSASRDYAPDELIVDAN